MRKNLQLLSFRILFLALISVLVSATAFADYYLSGLHSYAAGDPIPIPTWVYITSLSFIVISILAYRNKKKLKLKL